jgi:tripeptidyl-peptidase-1
VALRQRRPAELEQAVMEISTPGHARYGKHMSREEMRTYTAPTKRAVDDVTAWLEEYGIKYTRDNDWISLSTTVRVANDLLDTKFAWYQYADDHTPRLRALSYSVPDAIADHVDLVQPTTRFGQLGAKRSTIFEMHIVDDDGEVSAQSINVDAAPDATCGSTITPDCLKSLYNIKYTAKPDGNLVAFASYLEEYARYSDLQSFENKYVTQAKGQNFSVVTINGGLNDQSSSDDSGKFTKSQNLV